MKADDLGAKFWGLLALLFATAVEWLLIEVALKAAGTFVWFFPLVLMPLLSLVSMVQIWGTKSQRQRNLTLKYLAIYLPCIGIPLAVQVYGALQAQIWAWLVALPAQIFIPFWFSRKLEKIRREEASPAEASV